MHARESVLCSGANMSGKSLFGELMPQYKVLTQKDRYFSGKFSPEKLEAAINGYAEQGWRVISMTTARIPSVGRDREELVVLLERG